MFPRIHRGVAVIRHVNGADRRALAQGAPSRGVLSLLDLYPRLRRLQSGSEVKAFKAAAPQQTSGHNQLRSFQ
jgi:hypothetical protein